MRAEADCPSWSSSYEKNSAKLSAKLGEMSCKACLTVKFVFSQCAGYTVCLLIHRRSAIGSY
jgi:hypothetical protein